MIILTNAFPFLLQAGHERKMLKLLLEGKADATQVSHLLQTGVDPDVHDEVPYYIMYANCTMCW